MIGWYDQPVWLASMIDRYDRRSPLNQLMRMFEGCSGDVQCVPKVFNANAVRVLIDQCPSSSMFIEHRSTRSPVVRKLNLICLFIVESTSRSLLESETFSCSRYSPAKRELQFPSLENDETKTEKINSLTRHVAENLFPWKWVRKWVWKWELLVCSS